MKKFLFIVFAMIASTLANNQVRYDGHKVLRVTVNSEKQFDTLKKIVEEKGLDVWSKDSVLTMGENDIRVSNLEEEKLIKNTVSSSYILIDDVQALIDLEKNSTNVTQPNADWFASYHRYSEFITILKEWVTLYPNIATLVPSIGKTVEGRDIPAIRITGKKSSKRIWFNGGQHAREWIGPATVMFITHQLLTKYGKQPEVTKLVDDVEFIIVPMVNADGYEYSQTTERLWRKNRKRNSDGSFGVDLNRNWDDHWGGAGSSSNPRSETYHGTGPFSEPETTALSNYLSSFLPSVLGAIDFHSYSQLVLRPYGWTNNLSPDEKELKILGDEVRDSIYSVHKISYVSERSIDLYITTGSASDWFYQEGIWASYTIELRDTGRYGFLLPPSQIIPTGQEIFESMIFFVSHVLIHHP